MRKNEKTYAGSAGIDLFLSDVDGSLTTPDHRVTERAHHALAELKKQNIQFSIVSGRPPKGMRAIVSELGLTVPLAAFDGGMIIRPDLSVIEEHLIDEKTAASVIAAVETEGVDVWLYRGTDWFVKDGGGAHVLHETSNVGFEPIVVSDLNPTAGTVKIVAVSNDPERLARCEKVVKSAFKDSVSAQLSQTYYLDITHPKANKGEVVRSLSRILSIPANHFATLGDMPNDISMFKESGLSIAMGNASPEVNIAADYETRRNDDEGFAFAVESIVLPVALQASELRRLA